MYLLLEVSVSGKSFLDMTVGNCTIPTFGGAVHHRKAFFFQWKAFTSKGFFKVIMMLLIMPPYLDSVWNQGMVFTL